MPTNTPSKPEASAGKKPLNTWPGPKSKALFQEEQQYIAPGIQSIALLSQLTVEKGQGARFTDVDGNSYLDFNVGVSVASLGYSHPKYNEALITQLKKITVGSYTSQARLDLLKLIASITPKGLTRTQMFCAGTEAVESAFKLAKSVTKKSHIFGFSGGYHGKSNGVLPLSCVDWKNDVGPYPPGFHQAPYGDIEALRKQIKSEAPGQVAAIIAEPIQGTAGNIIPPDGYMKALKEVARENEALLIADEMITGFGRTGMMFGSNYDNVIPDIMTAGKGIAGGFPVSVVITTDALAQAKPWSLPSASSSSYGGNPLAAAACLAAVQTIVDDKLADNSARVGKVLLDSLKELQNKHACIGDVRGRGLLIGMDLVKDRKTKELLDKASCEKFFTEGLKRGIVLMSYSPRVRIHPPLTLTEAEAREGVALIDEALTAAGL